MKKLLILLMLSFSFCVFHGNEVNAGEISSINKVGAWNTWQSQDEMDDTVYFLVSTRSKSSLDTGYDIMHPILGFVGVKGEAYVMCNISKMPWLGAQDDVEVTYRLDKNKPQKSRWRTDKTSAYHKDAKQFANELYGHKTLLVRIPSKDGAVYTIKFDIAGTKEALNDIATAAGWK